LAINKIAEVLPPSSAAGSKLLVWAGEANLLNLDIYQHNKKIIQAIPISAVESSTGTGGAGVFAKAKIAHTNVKTGTFTKFFIILLLKLCKKPRHNIINIPE
jgi:hypothetical protein